jgi:hypothetical protein
MSDMNLDEVSQRPLKTLHADGIPELTLGATWLVWGILLGIPEMIPKDRLWDYYWLLVPLVLIGSGFGGQWLTRKLRERWSYSRAGYVEPAKTSEGRRIAVAFITLVTGMVVSGFIIRGRTWLDLMPLVVSWLVAAALYYGLTRQGASGAVLYSTVCIAIGIAITAAGLGIEKGFALLWAGVGLTMAIRGGLRLIQFVRSHEEVHG